MKKIVVYFFSLIIFLPISLSMIRHVTGIQFDVELKGYSDTVEKPELSMASFLNNEFQNNYGVWIEENMPLRGVLTKTYNSIRYKSFYLGNRPIGKNGSVFEEPYLYTELAIGDYDYSLPQNAQNIQLMVERMSSVNEKLKKHGKYLFVCVAPNKADVYPNDMPNRYVQIADDDAVNAVDLFREYISATNVPYLICSDMKDQLEYPAFYPTGIHWSRTYEQSATKRIIDELSDLSGVNYRNIEFTGVESSKEPYWRDSDVYDLLNVWTSPDVDYYQYTVKTEEDVEIVPLRILLVGDSFSSGLRKDMEDNLEEAFIYSVNRNSYAVEPDNTFFSLDGDWNNLNWQTYLDQSDFVVMEIAEPEMVYYGWGFLEYLDAYLDNYESQVGFE